MAAQMRLLSADDGLINVRGTELGIIRTAPGGAHHVGNRTRPGFRMGVKPVTKLGFTPKRVRHLDALRAIRNGATLDGDCGHYAGFNLKDHLSRLTLSCMYSALACTYIIGQLYVNRI